MSKNLLLMTCLMMSTALVIYSGDLLGASGTSMRFQCCGFYPAEVSQSAPEWSPKWMGNDGLESDGVGRGEIQIANAAVWPGYYRPLVFARGPLRIIGQKVLALVSLALMAGARGLQLVVPEIILRMPSSSSEELSSDKGDEQSEIDTTSSSSFSGRQPSQKPGHEPEFFILPAELRYRSGNYSEAERNFYIEAFHQPEDLSTAGLIERMHEQEFYEFLLAADSHSASLLQRYELEMLLKHDDYLALKAKQQQEAMRQLREYIADLATQMHDADFRREFGETHRLFGQKNYALLSIKLAIKSMLLTVHAGDENRFPIASRAHLDVALPMMPSNLASYQKAFQRNHSTILLRKAVEKYAVLLVHEDQELVDADDPQGMQRGKEEAQIWEEQIDELIEELLVVPDPYELKGINPEVQMPHYAYFRHVHKTNIMALHQRMKGTLSSFSEDTVEGLNNRIEYLKLNYDLLAEAIYDAVHLPRLIKETQMIIAAEIERL